MKISYSLAAISAAILLSSTSAFAQTRNANMGVSMVVEDSCTIEASPLNFGSVDIIIDDASQSSSLTIQCTSGTAYQVGLGIGNGPDATTAIRQMTNTVDPDATANYTLYQDANHDTLWGDTQGTTVDGTADGTEEVITVYGVVFGGQPVAAGSYADTVVATITYGLPL